MSARIAGFGHLGIYVRDIALMTEFWRDFMGMQITKQSDGAVFFSSDPERSDHEIVIMQGRPSAEDPHLLNQISMRVESRRSARLLPAHPAAQLPDRPTGHSRQRHRLLLPRP